MALTVNSDLDRHLDKQRSVDPVGLIARGEHIPVRQRLGKPVEDNASLRARIAGEPGVEDIVRQQRVYISVRVLRLCHLGGPRSA